MWYHPGTNHPGRAESYWMDVLVYVAKDRETAGAASARVSVPSSRVCTRVCVEPCACTCDDIGR
jgi:hypothetical protein